MQASAQLLGGRILQHTDPDQSIMSDGVPCWQSNSCYNGRVPWFDTLCTMLHMHGLLHCDEACFLLIVQQTQIPEALFLSQQRMCDVWHTWPSLTPSDSAPSTTHGSHIDVHQLIERPPLHNHRAISQQARLRILHAPWHRGAGRLLTLGCASGLSPICKASNSRQRACTEEAGMVAQLTLAMAGLAFFSSAYIDTVLLN